jgi:hypothetical protein
MASVEVAEEGGHWYWLGEVAEFDAAPVPVVMEGRAYWVVLRLLLPPPNTSWDYDCVCGLPTCVRPDHWRHIHRMKYRVETDFDGEGWQPVDKLSKP